MISGIWADKISAAMEPHGKRTRPTPIVRQAEFLNVIRGCFGCGLHLKFREWLRPLMLAVIVVAMPVLWPQTSSASGQTRIFVTESTSWSVSGDDVVHGKRRECEGIVETEPEPVLYRAVPSRRPPRS